MDRAALGRKSNFRQHEHNAENCSTEPNAWNNQMYEKILIAIDIDSPKLAELAIGVAIDLCKSNNKTKIRLINVEPLVPLNVIGYLPPHFDEEMRKDDEKRFAEFYTNLSYPSEAVTATIRYGSVHTEVLAEAEDCKANLIIVGSHRPEMADYVLGSSAASIVRYAKCSVLVVRE